MDTLIQQPVTLAQANALHPARPAWQVLLYRSLLYFLPLMALVLLFIATHSYLQNNFIEQSLRSRSQGLLEATSLAIHASLHGLEQDLDLIARHPDLMAYLSSRDPLHLQRLQSSWHQFSAAKRIYDQVRFIAADGMEVIRIDYGKNGATIVPEERLQDKSKRYYFRDSIGLSAGDIFVSRLDLNIENGQIEQPLKPMLRLAASIDHEGKRHGIVVLNYLADQLLYQLETHQHNEQANFFLLNMDGYYLKGEQPEKEWRFMFPDSDEEGRFSEDFPDVWSNATASPNGQVLNHHGLFSYQTVYFPAGKDSRTSHNTKQWILVNRIPPAALAAAKQPQLTLALTLALLSSIIIGIISFYLAYLTDTNRKYMRKENDLKSQLYAIMNLAPDAILCFNDNGKLQQINPAGERLLGDSLDLLNSKSLEGILPGLQQTISLLANTGAASEANDRTNVLRREMQVITATSDKLPVEASFSRSNINGEDVFISVMRDISERHEAADRLRQLSLFDELTSLPNRSMLHNQLENALHSSKSQKMFGALIFMDLDNFKNINDSLGHQAGDNLLIEATARIQACLNPEHFISRTGGDEFAILLPALNDDHDQAALLARQLSEKIQQAFSRPISIYESDYGVSCSFGIALFTNQDENAEIILKQTDTAMYRAKEAGRNTIRLFQPGMQQEVDQKLSISKELRKAISNNELALFYQPQIEASGRIRGIEALLRWNHPKKGMLSPDYFIRQAEEMGLSVELGNWVITRALQDTRSLLDHNSIDDLDFVAINISPQHFQHPEFVSKLKLQIEEIGVPPQKIELEITENLLLHDMQDAVTKMQSLQAIGIRFAIDDFGTGFSSLAYLNRLPLDRLKIDRSFVINVHENQHNASIVETIMAMARIHNLSLTAEGVETEAEKEWLITRKCDLIQGYFYSKPLPFGSFLSFCDHRADLVEGKKTDEPA